MTKPNQDEGWCWVSLRSTQPTFLSRFLSNLILLDTGVLIAFINKRERLHLWATEQWKMVAPPFFTCEAVITEACFLLQDVYEGEDAVMAYESETVRALMRQYQNVPMSLADACLVRMSELIKGSCILTLDSDFRVYRKHKNEIIDLIITDEF